jgi:mersacidin/lichenicidin family type 2 lantibiotic
MKKEHIIRAWRDPEFRAGLSDAERAALPSHPSGLLEVADADLTRVLGGGDAEIGDGDVVKEPAPIPVTSTRSTAVYSYGCSCICCV